MQEENLAETIKITGLERSIIVVSISSRFKEDSPELVESAYSKNYNVLK